MANNFIEENKEKEIKKNVSAFRSDQEEIKWTEPLLEENESREENKDKYNYKSTATKNINSKENDLIKKEINNKEKSFFKRIFNFLHKEEKKDFQSKKELISKQAEEIKREQNKKINQNKQRKDIAEIVQEKLKENKIKIDDGGTLKTNLMDGGPTILVDWKRIFLFFIFSLSIVALIISFLYMFLLFKRQKESLKGDELTEEIKFINTKIKKERKDIEEIDRFQDKLLISKNILDKHIYWTQFFKFLEDNTLENVYYLDGISGNIEGTYIFKAISDSYRNITEQLKVFNSIDIVEEARVNSGNMQDKKTNNEEVKKKQLSFDLELKVKPEIFYK